MERMVSRLGGAKIGSGFFQSYDFGILSARLCVTESAIRLRLLWINYYFDKASVVCLRRYQIIGVTGLQIVHTCRDYHDFVVFWPLCPLPFRFNRLKSGIQDLGFVVED